MADPFKKKKKDEESRITDTKTGTTSTPKPSVYKPNAGKAATTPKTTAPTKTTTPAKRLAQEKRTTGITRETDTGTRATSRIDYLGALGRSEPEKVDISKDTEDAIEKERQVRLSQLRGAEEKLGKARGRRPASQRETPSEEYRKSVDYWEYVKNAKEQAATETISLQNAIAEQRKKTELLGWDIKAKENELFNLKNRFSELSSQNMSKPKDYGSVAGVGEPGGRGVNSAESATEALEVQERIKQLERDIDQAKTYQYYKKGNDVLSALQETNYSAYKYVDAIAQYPADWYLKNSENGGAIDDGELLKQIQDTKDAAANDAKAMLRKMGYSDADIEQLVDFRVRQINEEYTLNLIATAQQMAQESAAGASIASVVTNIPAGLGFVDAAIQKVKNPDRPIDYNSRAMAPSLFTNTVRQQVSQDLIDKYGEKGKRYSFLYQTGMSMADSTVNMGLAALGVPESVGLTILGGSAATAAMKEAHDRGLSDTQALTIGLISGAAEYATEKIGLDKFIETLNKPKGSAKLLKNLINNALAEGGEEVASDVVNFIADAIITGDRSEFNTRVNELKALGYSEEECYKYAIMEQVANTALSFAGGALSGVAMGGVASGVNASNNAKITTDYYTGVAAGKGTVAYDAAQNLQRVIDDISSKSEEEITAEDHAAYQDAVDGLKNALASMPEEDLKEARKEGRELKKIDKERVKTTIGGLLGTRKSLEEYLKNPEQTELDNTVYSQNGIVQQAAGLVATGDQKKIATAVTTVMKSPDAVADLGLSFGEKTNNTQKRTQILTALKEVVAKAQATPQAETPVEVNNSTVGTPVTTDATAASPETATGVAAEEVPLPETLMSYEEYDRGVREQNPEVTPEETRKAYDELAKAYEDTKRAEQVKQDIKDREGKRVYIKEAKRAVDYDTFRRWALTNVKNDGNAYTEEEVRSAFDAGVVATQAETAKYELKRRKGVTDAGERIQKAFKKNQLSIGARVSFDGKDFGGTSATEHAFYDPATNSVVFNGDILDTEAAMVYYLGHEVVHNAKYGDTGLVDEIIETFQALSEAGKLRGKLAKQMENMDAELAYLREAYQTHEKELAKKEGREARTIDDDYVREEFAANLMRYAFGHTKLFKDIAGRRPGLVVRMKQAVGSVMSAVAGDPEVEAPMQKLADKLEAALKNVENANLLEHNPETIDRYALTDENIESLNEQNDGRLFSLSTMRQDLDGYIQDVRDAGLVGEGKVMTESELAELYDNINKVMDFVEAHIEEIERNEHYRNMTAENRPFSPYKPNGDPHYKMALDYSTLCRKRLLTQAITERLQASLKRALTPVEQVHIRDLLKKLKEEGKKIDVACALCYVEAARFQSPKVINEFLADRGHTVWMHYSLKDSAFKKGVYDVRSGDWKEQHGLSRKATKEQIKAKLGKESLDEYQDFLLAVREQYPTWLKRNNAERYETLSKSVENAEALDAQEFLSAQSLAHMRQNNPDLYDAFITKVRQATRSKAQETDVPYVRGDAKKVSKSLIAQMNKESGFRHQSWSDFQAMHLLDTVAAIMELSVRGAKMHTYTKVPDMVRFLGETGMMMNMSLIPAGETGFDENGNLVFDPNEGMDYQTMLELRKMFHNTAGNIAIGISDDQIRAMLASDEIDYIIPYHTSGLSADLRKRLGIKAWQDYTDTQNEQGTKAQLKKAPKLLEWFNEKEAALAPDGVAYMVEASKKYLQLCHERGLVPKFPQFLQKNDDDSYSLKDDAQNYWKLLIDRKMVDQYTGGIILQKAVVPKFDLDTMMDILENEVNSEAARDAREAEDYVVNKILTEGIESLSDEERAKLEDRARIIRDASLRKAVDDLAEETGMKRHSIAYNTAASDATRSKYAQAQEMIIDFAMENHGKPLTDEQWAEVREKTGWWRSPHDHQWRYWISDDEAELNPAIDNDRAEGHTEFMLYDLLRHDRLYQDYPELEDVMVVFDLPEGATAGKLTGGDTIHLQANAKLDAQTLSTLLHEVQHAIQVIEIGHYNEIQSGSNTDAGYKQAFVAAYRDLTDNGNDTSMLEGLSYKQAVRKIEKHIVKMVRSEPGLTERERRQYFGNNDGSEFDLTEEDLNAMAADWVKQRRSMPPEQILRDLAFEYYEGALGEIDARMTGEVAFANRFLEQREGRPRNDREFANSRIDDRINYGEETRRGSYDEVRQDLADFRSISRELGWDGNPAHLYAANYQLAESQGSRSYSIAKAPGEDTTLHIPDGMAAGQVVSFTDLILDGKKHGETRGLSVRLPVGRWIGIDKNGQVVGRVILGEPKRITNRSPEYEDAYIKGTKYDLADGEEKLYYPIVDVVDMRNDPKPVLRSSARYGVYQTGETGRQFSDPETGENVRYSLHVGEDPEPLRNPDGSVKYVYKAFYVLDGKLYPPMVANQTDENKKKKNVKGKVSGTQLGLDTPVGVWLDADVGRLARYGKDATEYDVALRRRWNGSSKKIKRIKETLQKQGINTKRGLTEEVRQAAVPLMEQVFPELRQASKTNIVERKGELVRNGSGRLAVENAKGGGTLAFRPGWHLGEWPDAKQFNVKGGLMPATLVFARCEISGDIDYQLAAMELGMTESGGYDRTQAGLPSVPVDGYYKYRTNADPTTAPWYIAGSMRVVEVLDDEECARVCREFGVEPSPREGGPIDLEAHGIKAGKVSPTEDLAPYQKSESVVQNAETLRAALADERYANAYTPRQLNFGDKEIQAEFARNRQDAGYYQAEYEKLGGKLASDSVGRRFSISPTYGHSIDLWDERGRPNDWTFTLGTTGDVLRALGAQERDIYMTAEKISQILVDHPNMTLEEIKNVPKVLENPTLILKSLGQSAQGHNTRLVVYGDLTDTNNVPVAVIFDLAPSESGVLVSDMYKVSSAYGKDDVNTPKAIEKSDVLYANKKRAPHLLRKLGFTESSVRVPGLLSAQGSGAGYSSLGSINDAAGNVNTNGTPFGQVFDYRYAIDSEDDELFQAFVEAYENKQGDGQLKKDFPTIEQQLREARRDLARAEKKAESEHAKRLVAEKVTKETREAWQMYARKTVAKQSEKFKAKLDAERQAKRDAVKAEREKAKAKLEETKLAERMNAGKKAAKRLGVKDDAYGKLKENVKERAILRRNSGLSALRNKGLAEQKRNVIETQQGPIDTMRKPPQERTFREKVADAAEKLRVTGRDLYAKFVSQSAAIERVTRRQRGPLGAGTLATIVGGVNSTVGHVFNNALVDKGGDVIGASFTDTFICTENDAGKVMDEPRQALLQDYLLHRHNVDRMSFVARAEERLERFEQQQPWLAEMNDKEFARLVALTDKEAEKLGKEEARRLAREYSRLLQELAEATDKEVFADLEGEPITAETSRERVAQLEREAPWLIEKAAGIDEWWDKFMRAWVVGTSITEEQYDHMREIYPHYVPTYRKDKGGFGFSFSSSNGATPGQFTKRATGSVKEIINVEDSFANLVQKGIKQARINELYQNLVDTAMLDHDGTFADMMFFDWLQYGRDIQEAARIDIGDHLEERDTAGLTKDGDGYRVSAWYDGELIHTYVSEELFKSLSLTVGHASDRLDKLARLGSALTSPMKTAITGINPNFALRNMARDIPTAIVNSVSGLAFPKYWAMAWGEIRRNSEHWQRYQALGGGDALYYNNEGGYGKATNMTKGTKGAIQRGWNTVKGKVGWFNEITESVTRFAEYLATIERLGDTYEGRLQARKNAAEVTVDFSRHGEYGKAINAWIPYWNPAVQGIDKVIRSVVETKEGEAKLAHALKTIGKAAVTTALLDAILHAVLTALDKEKDWEKLDDRTKDTYYCIPYADNKYIKIPKNREWGAILGTPLVRLWEWGFNGRENPFENWFETSFWPNFMPGMPLMLEDGKLRSDIIGISQALDLANNTDFAGRTIIPYAYQQGSKAGQYNAETSQFTKWLSDALGNKLSPMQLDYIIKDYFGDFGKMFTQATSIGLLSGEVSPEDVADYALSIVINPWKADNRFSNQYMSKYYEIRDELEDKVNDLKNHADGDSYKETIEYKTYQALTKGLGKDISDLNKSIRNETDEEVKGRVKGQMVELAQQAIEFYNDCMAGKIDDPELVVAYRDLPQSVSDALIKLDDLTKDYAIKPSEVNTDTMAAEGTLKIGNTTVYQYKLDDEAKQKRTDLREQYYAEYMQKTVDSSAFKTANEKKQAEMLEDARSDAYNAAADDFNDWLKKNRKPELKDERELPKAYKALSSSTRTELTNLYGKPGTEKYTFTPADNTTKSYSDPDSKQGTKTTREYKLDDEALAYYDKLRQDYYESYVSKAMRSSAYKKASDVRKAEILAEARKQAYDDAREQLMKWLKKNRKSTPKD